MNIHHICPEVAYIVKARRALSILRDVPLTTRRALSQYKVYGDSILALNGISLNHDSAHWL